MARQLTPFGKVVVMTTKWLIIPILVGLIGYKLIGPNIRGAKSDPKSQSSNPIEPQSPSEKKFQSVREGNG